MTTTDAAPADAPRLAWARRSLATEAATPEGILAVIATTAPGAHPRVTFASAPARFLSTREQGRVATVADGTALLDAAMAATGAPRPAAEALAAAGFGLDQACPVGGRPGGSLWSRRAGRGRFQVALNDLFVGLHFDGRGVRDSRPLLALWIGEVADSGEVVPCPWPAALASVDALCAVAIAMAGRYEADGRAAAPAARRARTAG